VTVDVRTPDGESVCRLYVVAGVPCSVTGSRALLESIDEAYGAFRTDRTERDAFAVSVTGEAAGFVVRDSTGFEQRYDDQGDAAFAVIECVVRHVTVRLAAHGTYAVHAGSLVHDGGALIISGKSGAGKTTLTLALVSRGLRILSDEFALSAPDATTILPYRRGVHIRPGTPELIAELQFLHERPYDSLSGGLHWTLPPAELEKAFPSCLAEPAPLQHVVLLEGRRGVGASELEPVENGVAAVELVGATTTAADDFSGAMRRMTRLVDDVRCARLQHRNLESSVELLLSWLVQSDD
jgi:hypothetical protein